MTFKEFIENTGSGLYVGEKVDPASGE